MYLARKCKIDIQYTYELAILLLPLTGKVVSFLSGFDEVGIKNKRSIFFNEQKVVSS
jgi:hypothetical protein